MQPQVLVKQAVQAAVQVVLTLTLLFLEEAEPLVKEQMVEQVLEQAVL
jgi:hypothetical protein